MLESIRASPHLGRPPLSLRLALALIYLLFMFTILLDPNPNTHDVSNRIRNGGKPSRQMLNFKPPSQARREKTPRHHSDLPCTGVKRRAKVDKTNLLQKYQKTKDEKYNRDWLMLSMTLQ